MRAPTPSADEKRKHLAAAKRWCYRAEAARGRLEKMRCHEQRMRHIYSMLGVVPDVNDPGKLL